MAEYAVCGAIEVLNLTLSLCHMITPKIDNYDYCQFLGKHTLLLINGLTN